MYSTVWDLTISLQLVRQILSNLVFKELPYSEMCILLDLGKVSKCACMKRNKYMQ